MAGRLVARVARHASRSLQKRQCQAMGRYFSSMAISDERFLRYNSPTPKDIDHTMVLGTPETKVTTLSNGLRVASESNMSAETATVGVWIDAGSRFETAETNGTAHFLEHMIFKGTKKRNLRQLEEEIENMGGHLNAYTSREQTTYYAKVLKKDVPVAVDILADILQNSSFEEDRINRERNVILREMEEGISSKLTCNGAYFHARFGHPKRGSLRLFNGFFGVGKVEGQVEEVMFDHLHATAFQYTPLGRTILGPAENIRNITKDNLRDYISKHYTGPRMVVAAAGAVNHDELVKTVEKSFQNLSTDPTTAGELVMQEPASFTGSEVRLRDDDCPLAYFAVAVSGAPWTDPDSIALMVMQTMLGAWNKSAGAGKHMGSEMAQQISANDLAESVMAFNTNYSDSGLFGVYAVAKEEHLDDLCYVIMHQLGRMIYRVEAEDVARARNQLKSCLLLHLDGTSPIAEDIGRQMLTYGRRVPLAELFARIDAVDAECVKRVAARFIYDKEVAIAGMGPLSELRDYTWFRRRTYWLRY